MMGCLLRSDGKDSPRGRSGHSPHRWFTPQGNESTGMPGVSTTDWRQLHWFHAPLIDDPYRLPRPARPPAALRARGRRHVPAPARLRRLHLRVHLPARGRRPRAVPADDQRAGVALSVTPQWLATGIDAPFAEPVDLIEAEVALRLGDIAEAEQLYRARVQPGDPCRPAALAGLGQIAFRSGDFTAGDHAPRGGARPERPGRSRPERDRLASDGPMPPLARASRRSRSSSRPSPSASPSTRRSSGCVSRSCSRTRSSTTGFLGGRAAARRSDPARGDMRDPLASARVFWSQSRLHSLRGEAPLAARYARRALDILERTENTAYVGMAYHLLAFAEIEAGRGEECARPARAWPRALRRRDRSGRRGYVSRLEARALLLAGRVRTRPARPPRRSTSSGCRRATAARPTSHSATSSSPRATPSARAELYEAGLEFCSTPPPRALEAGRSTPTCSRRRGTRRCAPGPARRPTPRDEATRARDD